MAAATRGALKLSEVAQQKETGTGDEFAVPKGKGDTIVVEGRTVSNPLERSAASVEEEAAGKIEVATADGTKE